MPDGETPRAHLRKLAMAGERGRYPAGAARVRARIEHELELIAELRLRAVLPHGARRGALRAQRGHPVPGARLGGEFGRSATPRDHRGRPARSRRCRALHLRSATSRPTSTSISSTSGARRSSSTSIASTGASARRSPRRSSATGRAARSRRRQGARIRVWPAVDRSRESLRGGRPRRSSRAPARGRLRSAVRGHRASWSRSRDVARLPAPSVPARRRLRHSARAARQLVPIENAAIAEQRAVAGDRGAAELLDLRLELLGRGGAGLGVLERDGFGGGGVGGRVDGCSRWRSVLSPLVCWGSRLRRRGSAASDLSRWLSRDQFQRQRSQQNRASVTSARETAPEGRRPAVVSAQIHSEPDGSPIPILTVRTG